MSVLERQESHQVKEVRIEVSGLWLVSRSTEGYWNARWCHWNVLYLHPEETSPFFIRNQAVKLDNIWPCVVTKPKARNTGGKKFLLTLVRPGKMAISAGRGIAWEGTCKVTVAVFMVEAAAAHPSPVFRLPGANLAAVALGKNQSLWRECLLPETLPGKGRVM